MSTWKLVASCLDVWVSVTSLAYSAEAAPVEKPEAVQESSGASAGEIAALVEQLDSDKFAERQAASEKLSAIGKPAIPALAEAAAGESLEVTVRSLAILKELLESPDEPTKEAAKSALEQIAKSDRPSAARRAEDALKSLQQPQPPAGIMLPGGIQIAVAAAGGGRRVSVKNVNGVKEIEADEGERKIKIVDDPKQGIKMEVTTKKNGKDVTEKYEAKNADELKKKHPKAYEFYKQYGQNQGGVVMQFQIGGAVPIRIGGQAIPVPGRAAARRLNTIDMAKKLLPAWSGQLKGLASDDAISKASSESKQELAKQSAEMRKQLEDLEKRLQEAIEKAEKAEKAEAEGQPREPSENPAEDPK